MMRPAAQSTQLPDERPHRYCDRKWITRECAFVTTPASQAPQVKPGAVGW